jgi:hypothetical protein
VRALNVSPDLERLGLWVALFVCASPAAHALATGQRVDLIIGAGLLLAMFAASQLARRRR